MTLEEAIRQIRATEGYDPFVLLHEAEEGVEQHWQFFDPKALRGHPIGLFPTYLLSEAYGLEKQED